MLLLSACSEDEVEASADLSIPESFTVDIPNSLSSPTGGLSSRQAGDGDGVVEGDEIYAALPHFIKLGEASAEIIESSLQLAGILQQLGITSYTFESEDDNRTNRLDLSQNVTKGGVSYAYEMTMTDIEADELAIQILWNNDPVSGIGILRPYYIDAIENDDQDTYVRIDYSESNADYEAIMEVSVTGLDTPDDSEIDNLKMFVGKNGDLVEITGNSNHPEMVIIDQDYTGGRNYAFVGRGDQSMDIGVVKLALPPSKTDTKDVLETYSVFAVLEDEIETAGITDQDIIDAVLDEAQSPAYFSANGFITSGTSSRPEGFSTSFVNLEGLQPYAPMAVRDMTITFLD